MLILPPLTISSHKYTILLFEQLDDILSNAVKNTRLIYYVPLKSAKKRESTQFFLIYTLNVYLWIWDIHIIFLYLRHPLCFRWKRFGAFSSVFASPTTRQNCSGERYLQNLLRLLWESDNILLITMGPNLMHATDVFKKSLINWIWYPWLTLNGVEQWSSVEYME